MHDPLSALDRLERRYDGPIPLEARLTARFGSVAAVRAALALGEAHFFTTLARNQVEAIRRARAAHHPDRALCNTLEFYLAERRHFRRIAGNPSSNACEPAC
jgi:hypothetical protein